MRGRFNLNRLIGMRPDQLEQLLARTGCRTAATLSSFVWNAYPRLPDRSALTIHMVKLIEDEFGDLPIEALEDKWLHANF
ncbi:hypothetical protein [Methyloferula stellata]|uniref:hypothetical protein n=1 Tax=Methyloferula stellata TaxID=876270 RepID=UPI001268743A|nr:hypothetical protein [Methyloferula stellata]